MMIPRKVHAEIESYVSFKQKNKPVLLVEGARQTGKTTAVEVALRGKNHLFIDLEKERIFREKIDLCPKFSDFEELLLDEFGFRPNQGQILVIDEAQESSMLGAFVRYMKEDWDEQTTVLLGSVMSRLFRSGVREPVGRVHRIIVYPFSFKEFLLSMKKPQLIEAIETWNPERPFSSNRHHELIALMQVFIRTGGLPGVVNAYCAGLDAFENLWQHKIQYEDDFIRVFGTAKLSIFQRILKRISETLGYPCKKSSIIKTNQPGYRELDDMLSQVQRWYLAYKIEQDSYQPTKSGTVTPKRYLFDVGLAQLLSSAARPEIDLTQGFDPEVRTPLGGLIENIVLHELFCQGVRQVSGWRYKTNGSEIDFVAKNSQGTVPIEVKCSPKTKSNQMKPLCTYLDLYSLKKGYFVNLAPGGKFSFQGANIYQIPIYCVSEISRLF